MVSFQCWLNCIKWQYISQADSRKRKAFMTLDVRMWEKCKIFPWHWISNHSFFSSPFLPRFPFKIELIKAFMWMCFSLGLGSGLEKCDVILKRSFGFLKQHETSPASDNLCPKWSSEKFSIAQNILFFFAHICSVRSTHSQPVFPEEKLWSLFNPLQAFRQEQMLVCTSSSQNFLCPFSFNIYM